MTNLCLLGHMNCTMASQTFFTASTKCYKPYILWLCPTPLQELFKSIEKMRPKLFRMASELKENEEGMSDILRTNDSVLRVMDLYKNKTSGFPPLPSSNDGANSNEASKDTGSSSEDNKKAARQSSSSTEPATATSAQNGATGGVSDVLIDLADLNFGTTPVSGAEGGAVDLNSSLGLSSLMDDITALGEQLIVYYLGGVCHMLQI